MDDDKVLEKVDAAEREIASILIDLQRETGRVVENVEVDIRAVTPMRAWIMLENHPY